MMQYKKKIAALLAAVLCAAVLSACAAKQPAPAQQLAVSQQPSGETEDQQPSGETDSQQLPEDSAGEIQSEPVGASLGEFSTQDVNGNAYTQEMFADYDLTFVNIFATWCSPCVAEMPELEELYQQMKEQGVNVVGFVLDVLDEEGEIVPESLERAQELVERTGVTYPILLPDEGYLNGRLTGIEAIPETFFVDKNGNVVGGTYVGSNDLEGWLEVVEQELAALDGEAS